MFGGGEEEREGKSEYKFQNLFIHFLGYPNAFVKALVILHTDALSKMGCVAERQKWQVPLCWSIYTFQLCLKGGTSLVTFYSPPKYGPLFPFFFFSLVCTVLEITLGKKKRCLVHRELHNMHTTISDTCM